MTFLRRVTFLKNNIIQYSYVYRSYTRTREDLCGKVAKGILVKTLTALKYSKRVEKGRISRLFILKCSIFSSMRGLILWYENFNSYLDKQGNNKKR